MNAVINGFFLPTFEVTKEKLLNSKWSKPFYAKFKEDFTLDNLLDQGRSVFRFSYKK